MKCLTSGCLLPRFHDLWVKDDSKNAVRCHENTQHRVYLQHESLEHYVVVLLSVRDEHPAQQIVELVLEKNG